MIKTKFNLVGDTFTHLTGGNKGYSVHGKESKYIEWNKEWVWGCDTFFIDDRIEEGYDHSNSPHKYGWLLESRNISSAIDRMKNTDAKFYRRFDAIFTHDKELLAMDSVFKFVPAQGSWIKDPLKWVSKWHVHPKRKLVSMIASNKDWTSGHMERLGWVKKLRGRVDLYGRGFNPIEFKEQGLDDYMFSVAIENGQYETYFTEKLLDCFLSCTIPIYSGAPDVGDYFNLDGILRLDEFDTISRELYESKLPAAYDNYQRALKMEVLEDYIWENYLNG